MIKLEGTVLNTYHLDGGTNKKGEEYEARDKVQLLGSLELPNGQIKNELIDLTVEDSRIYDDFKNKLISISCGAMAVGRNVIFYVRKGAKPVLVDHL
ncbi:hypothetical protein A0118_RS18850 [Acinetobacter baumannii]|uniref:Uncharacterized protein n=1 Tax=Acinetobacter baumannii TaxID=470 RepID=A0A5N5XW88_ACIBA|nr:hypothetical protein [Acinetobacter baumannii]EHU1616739.1 hypothetical protein [Acinetobacter baumannii]EHU2522796.1 hypothetical protein [Acinetobacter baumannii]KAB8125491.1 hypothetical protein FDO31_20870 [Acinetobacter baumannii]MQQ74374.1 hypothetical protein [Acinetobacter baumannii]MQQ85523.1 hypothetical protein [Acinetobacter baumannii]